jgi:molybdopterin-guanine dinucleotide biosynthesis protein MobB
MLERLGNLDVDLILIEGFKHERYPKIELHRVELDNPRLYPDDPDIIAVACDGPMEPATRLPLLDINDPVAIAEFIVARLRNGAAESEPEAVA